MVFEYLGNTGTTAVQLFATDGHNACRASVLRSSPVYNVHGPIWWSFSKAIAALVSVVFCHSSWVFTPWRRRWSPGDSRWDSFHWLQRTFGAVSDLHSCLWTCCCSHLSGWVELVVFCSVLQVSNLEYPVCAKLEIFNHENNHLDKFGLYFPIRNRPKVSSVVMVETEKFQASISHTHTALMIFWSGR